MGGHRAILGHRRFPIYLIFDTNERMVLYHKYDQFLFEYLYYVGNVVSSISHEYEYRKFATDTKLKGERGGSFSTVKAVALGSSSSSRAVGCGTVVRTVASSAARVASAAPVEL